MGINKEIIKRFIANRFSVNDFFSVASYFKTKRHAAALKDHMEEEWKETENASDKSERLNQLLDSLHCQINKKQSLKPGPRQNFYHLFSRVAVILLIPALITIAVLAYLLVNNESPAESFVEIHAPTATRVRFQLPDGTKGWLNSGSSIKYPVSFSERRVEISGEAWFDVIHQRSGEFRVITPYFNVKVLGTQFNIVAYENEGTAQVILEKGKVAVYDKNDNKKAELIPDQQLVYHKTTKELVKRRIDSKTYTSWKDGVLIFKNEPMSEIAQRLERTYNAEIILHDDLLKAMVFRATFRNESLDEICRALSDVAPIQYKIHKREKQADETFTKSKIEMWLK
ncbi:MAG: FecR family protein [Mangrovibacterium sp.]